MDIPDPEVATYRGLTVVTWRTDDPCEGPEDDPRDDHENWEPTEPWEIGDFYFGIVEWELQIGASLATHDGAMKAAAKAIDAVLGDEGDPRHVLRASGADPLEFHYPKAPAP